MTTVASRALRFHELGEPLDVLREDDVEVVDPPAGGTRIRVAATGLNPADWELCRGFMPGLLPRGVGCDAAGTVDALGEGVDHLAVGDVVFGPVDFAGQTSAGAADVAILTAAYPVPPGLDPAAAAALPMVVTTAEWTLDLLLGDRGPGTTLLVHGAGGMVGFAAVQIALGRGIRVIATAGPTFAEDLAGFGALVTSYGEGLAGRVRRLAGGDVDAVLDVPRPREGVLPELVSLAGGDPQRVMTISNHGEARRIGARVNVDELAAAGSMPGTHFLAHYARLAADGRFRIPIAQRFLLHQWRDAVRLSLSGAPHGKLVLVPQLRRDSRHHAAPSGREALPG